MADPQFNVPGKIDILLGADVIEDVMLDNRIKDNGLHIKEFLFGWIVSGPINANATESICANHVTLSDNTDAILAKFWELENIPHKKHLTTEEKLCEKHYDTTRRNENGRFVVQMPFKENSRLGLSKATAMRRYLNLERKLHANPELIKSMLILLRNFWIWDTWKKYQVKILKIHKISTCFIIVYIN